MRKEQLIQSLREEFERELKSKPTDFPYEKQILIAFERAIANALLRYVEDIK